MTPAERAVIEAALEMYRLGLPIGSSTEDALMDAAGRLEAERAAKPDEAEHPWGEVVTTDEIYSVKTARWYRVLEVTRLDDWKTRVRLEGVTKPFTNDSSARVLVRRSPMGQAVDTWIDVMRSGPA